jgi:hypothetical protein
MTVEQHIIQLWTSEKGKVLINGKMVMLVAGNPVHLPTHNTVCVPAFDENDIRVAYATLKGV